MNAASRIIDILRGDPIRWHLLGIAADLDLPDCWIGAGFVRNAIWDHLHGRDAGPPQGDVDVIWYDPNALDPAEDKRLELRLAALAPSIAWSVKNQARMHTRNGDAPYTSSSDAMTHWPETATAIAARRCGVASCEIAAPFGLDDLFNLSLRPTPRFRLEKRSIYEKRVSSKAWKTSWPLLQRVET